jgi:HK97 gp10 family phage protein
MIEMTVHVEGLSEVQEALRSMLPDRTARAVMKRVLLKRAEPIATRARALAPRRSGRLKISIVAGSSLTRRQRMQTPKTDPDDVEVFVGAGPVAQAHLQEFGSSVHKAQPFMRPAWDSVRGTILSGLGSDMWTEINKSAARLARKTAKG